MTKTKTKQTESTALMVLTPEEQAYLDSLKTTTSSEQTGPARLTINLAGKDSDGNRRIIGSWHIKGTDKYFDGPITFRPVRVYKTLVKYNVDSNNNYTLAGETIYFTDWSTEIVDSLGGIALGRKMGKRYSAEEKEATRNLAELYTDIFGFVSWEGQEETPVVYRTRGTKAVKMENAFSSVPKDKQFSLYNYSIETFQPEGKQYFDIEVIPDMSKTLPIMPILGYDKEIQEYVTEHNLRVISAHKQKTKDITTIKVVNNNTTDIEELDDELPF